MHSTYSITLFFSCHSCCNSDFVETQGLISGSIWLQGRSHKCSFHFFLYSRVIVNIPFTSENFLLVYFTTLLRVWYSWICSNLKVSCPKTCHNVPESTLHWWGADVVYATNICCWDGKCLRYLFCPSFESWCSLLEINPLEAFLFFFFFAFSRLIHS